MFRVAGWAASGLERVKADNILKFRSLGWWASNSRAKGALHGKPVHARSGPRRRWEAHIHGYAGSVGSSNWMELVLAPEAQNHRDAFASRMVLT